ncbi:MAG: cobalt-precorrin-5B (C(1))-methyltransferase [Butyrivibrio sp.]|nr:cobalt-precorrin-5B (C(1))-methyltransferase [Butyrivibrio sp.]
MDKFGTRNMGFILSPLSSGDCAAAAARAAAADLIFSIESENITVHHKNGASRTISVTKIEEKCSADYKEYSAVMEGGTAPDIREKAHIHVGVSFIHDMSTVDANAHIDLRYGNLFLAGGEGIGSAPEARPGLLKGEPLIEKDSRKLIFDAVNKVCEMSDGAQLLLIRVSCPEGAIIAAKQTMGQNVFTGGITIMGEYGSIDRLHQRDISNIIDRQIMAQTAMGVKSILVAPGYYCADAIYKELHVDLKTCIRCYNFPGHAIDEAVAQGVENLLLVGNVGKLVKLAAGIMNTNSTASDARKEIFAAHTSFVGGTSNQGKIIMNCVCVDEILAHLDSWGLRESVMESIMGRVQEAVKRRCGGKLNFGVALFSETFGLLGQTENITNVITKVSQEQYALSLKLK